MSSDLARRIREGSFKARGARARFVHALLRQGAGVTSPPVDASIAAPVGGTGPSAAPALRDRRRALVLPGLRRPHGVDGTPLPGARRGISVDGTPLPAARRGISVDGTPLPGARRGISVDGTPLPAARRGISVDGTPLPAARRPGGAGGVGEAPWPGVRRAGGGGATAGWA
ncbi:hypothetical protein GCM10010166_29570 [Couchioplanes caeruleus subsp. azureus]|nr:hypothetical protein GCM10010166_29570 [Couchioplanes caeruleus subsp. azureus]